MNVDKRLTDEDVQRLHDNSYWAGYSEGTQARPLDHTVVRLCVEVKTLRAALAKRNAASDAEVETAQVALLKLAEDFERTVEFQAQAVSKAVAELRKAAR